jgi:PAS domain S-box-containing protein
MLKSIKGVDKMSIEQYIKAIENANIVSKTDSKGVITFVSDEFCNISEFSREELVGRNHNIVRHPDVPKQLFKELWQTIEEKKVYNGTIQSLSKQGKTFYFNTTIIPILDEKSHIIEYVAIRYNITKEIQSKIYREQLEEALQEQKALFMQSRFASLGQMLANIAHQWRQPLSELNLVLFSLKKSAEKKDYEKVGAYYKKSKELTKSMSQTIEVFSDFFNPNKLHQDFHLTVAVDDAIRMLRDDLESEGIEIETYFEDIYVKGISNELTQVVVNLLLNSKDAFIQQSKTLKPSIYKIIRKINIRVSKSYIGTKSYALIIVEDSAGGIPSKDIDKIFEPYFSTKHASVGTGIGLFISNLIIQKSLHGTIEVINSVKGAKFTITIPLKEEM